MKKLILLSLILSGCATTQKPVDSGKELREAYLAGCVDAANARHLPKDAHRAGEMVMSLLKSCDRRTEKFGQSKETK